MARDHRLHAIVGCILTWSTYLIRLSCLLAVTLTSISSAKAQTIFLLNCSNNYFPLYCRGQLPVLSSPPNTTGTIFLTFLSNVTAAGNYGDTLANNSCAFADRPLNAGEANELEWNIFLTVNSQTVVDPAYAPFLACNMSNNCVSNFCVQNNNNGALVIQSATGQVFQEYAGSMSSGSSMTLQTQGPLLKRP